MHRRGFLQTGLIIPSLAFKDWFVPGSQPRPANAPPFIVNAGIGGNNTADLLARIDRDCLAHRPDLTILMIGTNDMNSMKHIPLPKYEQNLRELITRIRNSGSQVLLMTILPVYEPYLYTRHPQAFYAPEGHSERKRQVNETIRKAAEDFQQPLLDMHHIFEKAGNIGLEPDSLLSNEANTGKTDGVHPTSQGYRTMAVAVYEFIMQRQLPHNAVVCFGDSITNGGGGVEGKSYPAYLKKLLAY
jgi:lysophospholipase L1-like esterase